MMWEGAGSAPRIIFRGVSLSFSTAGPAPRRIAYQRPVAGTSSKCRAALAITYYCQGGGNDCYGTNGTDYLYDGPGRDYIYAYGGADYVYANYYYRD
jgi:hypothetical protein